MFNSMLTSMRSAETLFNEFDLSPVGDEHFTESRARIEAVRFACNADFNGIMPQLPCYAALAEQFIVTSQLPANKRENDDVVIEITPQAILRTLFRSATWCHYKLPTWTARSRATDRDLSRFDPSSVPAITSGENITRNLANLVSRGFTQMAIFDPSERRVRGGDRHAHDVLRGILSPIPPHVHVFRSHQVS